ncbi:conjugative transposon protein TraJ [Mucilaginibacter sp. HMF5004]|uniref:conjugative transposon protein TraJ n=1 Tax=Mucilaginibacter rivuli TaxID=2857527 RepID=UPI001C5EE7BC|nr:conjugative transposon protein TraJ [Mucilaginibacter rivuli]MBW4888961.1 conjugative transposon protein TraJ [Mucilaginibacter rivuli]
MKRKTTIPILTIALLVCSPAIARAQGVADDIHSLQGILNSLYNQMIPMCSGMIGVARGIAGFATLWYIAARVWKHMASAEPVDIYPLLRPFAIGFCILVFPSVLSLMNGVLQPVVTATQSMVTNSNQAIAVMLDGQQKAPDPQQGTTNMNGDPDKWYQYSHPDGTSTNGTAATTNMADQFSGWGWKNMIKKAIAELLNVLFEAAALCIDTIRTFKLIVLAILGPLCFGFSVFDGFQHTLKQWIARYVNVFMWLPVANIFGAIIAKIQENMIRLQQSGNLQGNEFGNSNTAYLIFMVIGIVGYFTVPSIAGYIVNVGGHALFNKTSALASMATTYVGGLIMQNMTQTPPPKDPAGSAGGQDPMRGKLSGKT